MAEEIRLSLEKALAKTEEDAIATLKATQSALSAVRKMRSASHVGNLQELNLAIEAAGKAIDILKQQFINAKECWDFPQESYLSDGSYTKEILDMGDKMGIRIFDRDDRLYCYPSLVKINPAERSVFIDKSKVKSLRPSVLINQLKKIQTQPPRFRPEAFLESLFRAYEIVIASRQKELLSNNPPVPLLKIYELFTLLPGKSKEYSKQEFSRDVYLLDKSGINTTKNGSKARFYPPRSKFDRKSISTVKEDGEEIDYRDVSFSSTGKE